MAPAPTRAAQTNPPVIVIHGLDEALAALNAARETGIAVRLQSAPAAAAHGGAAWFQALVAEACKTVPGAMVDAALDCADQPGLALGALRQGLKVIRITGPAKTQAKTQAKIAAIAARHGAMLEHGRGPALDLSTIARAEWDRALRAFLVAALPGSSLGSSLGGALDSEESP